MLKNNQKNTAQPNILETLLNHCPSGSEPLIRAWLENRKLEIRISKKRHTKLGDFRPPQNGFPARISINGDLNQTEFIITLVHELAHHDNFLKNGSPGIQLRIGSRRRKSAIKPHGQEWKAQYRAYLQEIIDFQLFEPAFNQALVKCYFKRERIATSSCAELKHLLEAESGVQLMRVQDLPEGAVFEMRGGRQFIRGPKLRSRYRCKDLNTGKMYTIHSLAPIVKKPL